VISLKRPLRFGLATVSVVVIFLVVAALSWAHPILTLDSGPVKADVMVLLGGGSVVRPQRVVELYKAGAAAKIIITGTGDCERNQQVLETNGVPESAILLEPMATTTFENAKFSLPLLRQLGSKRVLLVTSWYHTRRAVACFRHFAPDIQFYSAPATLNDTGQKLFIAVQEERVYTLKEYPKLLFYWLWHGVQPF